MTTVTVLTQKSLTTPLGYIEQTSDDAIPTSGTMSFPGPIYGLNVSLVRNKIVIPQAGDDEDIREAKYAEQKMGALQINHGVIDTTLLDYYLNKASGAGTVAKALSWAATINELGSTKYFLMEYCKPATAVLSSGKGLAIAATAAFAGRYPTGTGNSYLLSAWTSKPTLASDPGKATKPVWIFSGGGTNPVTWDGDNVGVNAISLSYNRLLYTDFSANNGDITINECMGRRFRWGMNIDYDTTGRDLIEDLTSGTVKELVWTVKSGTYTLTLTDCGLDPIDLSWLPPSANPKIDVDISGKCVSIASS